MENSDRSQSSSFGNGTQPPYFYSTRQKKNQTGPNRALEDKTFKGPQPITFTFWKDTNIVGKGENIPANMQQFLSFFHTVNKSLLF